jgi:hypothetical protein
MLQVDERLSKHCTAEMFYSSVTLNVSPENETTMVREEPVEFGNRRGIMRLYLDRFPAIHPRPS